MTKQEAINNYGESVVEKARDLYETDFGKVLFIEDCNYEDDCPACEDDVLHYLFKASK